MLSLATSVIGTIAAIAGFTGASPYPFDKRQNTYNSIQNWSNDYAKVDFNNLAGGEFNVTWDNGAGGNFVVGKGLRPGGDMLFNYTGQFQTSGWAYLALYGWTTNPLVEYYVIESMGKHNPSDNASATLYGSLESDGGTYEIWQKERTNAPSIVGDNTNFQQYWSIRTKMHVGGTINTGNHFRAWEAAGLPLGKQNYMVMGVEGQQGAGSADITVGALPTTKVPETTTSTYRSIRRTTTRKPTSLVFTTPTPTPARSTSAGVSSVQTTSVKTSARVSSTRRATSTRKTTSTRRGPAKPTPTDDGDDDNDDNDDDDDDDDNDWWNQAVNVEVP